MADGYDGEIRINTKIDTKNLSSQFMSLQNRILKTGDKISSLTQKMKEMKNVRIPTDVYSALVDKLKNAKLILDSFSEEQRKMQARGFMASNQDKEYLEVYRNIQKLKAELNSSIADRNQDYYLAVEDSLNRQKSILSELMSKNPRPLGDLAYYESIDMKLNLAKENVSKIEKEIEALQQSGQAFSSKNADGSKYQKLSEELIYAQREMDVLIQKQSELKARQDKTAQSVKKIGDNTKASMEKANKSIGKSGGVLKSFATRLKGITLSLLVFNWITKGFNAMISAMKEGLQNLAQYSSDYNKSVSSLKSANTQLKNSFATAFAPIIQTVIPYLVKLIGYITTAMNTVAQFIAMLSGKSTYTKAVSVQQDYAASLTSTGNAAKKAAKELKGYLSPIDEINKFSKENEEADSGSGSGLNPKDMFEEVPIDSRITKISNALKPILDYVKQLGSIFNGGFMDGLGDWQYRVDAIKIGFEQIKTAVMDIWTDPQVLNAADGWAKSLARMLGTFNGSVASIGLTIAANLIGGIGKYLEGNTDRIKQYLIDSFDIRTEIYDLLSELFASLAYVFEAFASENGIKVSANIIGIISDAIMGASEIVGKLMRDLLALITAPFTENKEEFRTALEEYLGTIGDVLGTLKKTIDDIFDNLNSVYDEKLKPMFDSIEDGLSDTVGKLLEYWRNDIQPVLDEMAKKFDDIYEKYLKPIIENFMNLIGDLADIIKVLFESILKPSFDWIVESIRRVLSPVIKGLGNVFMTVFDAIAGIIDGLMLALRGLTNFLAGVFTLDMKRALTGIKDFFRGIVNGIISLLEGAINFVGSALNTITIDVPEWVPLIGGKKWNGFGIPNVSIPRLATGTVIPPGVSQFLAVLGDNNKETEVVSPLSTMKQALKEAMAESGNTGGGTQIINLILDGMVVAKAVIKNGKVIQMITGNNPFELA